MSQDTNQQPSLFKQALGDTTTTPKIFTPPVVQNIIPEAQYSSMAGTLALKSIDPTVQGDANRLTLDSVVTTDQQQKQTDLNVAIKNTLSTTNEIPMQNKITAAQAVLQQGTPASSIGNIYKDTTFPTPDTQIHQAVDKSIVKDDIKANVLTNLGYNSTKTDFNQVMNKPSNELFNALHDAFTSIPLPAIGAITSQGKVGEAVKTLAEEGINKAIGFISDKLSSTKQATLKDVAEYLSYIPVHPEIDLDMQSLVKGVFSKNLLETKLTAMINWDKQFRTKYGEDGYFHAAAFFLKEGIIDAGALTLALKSPALASKLLPETSGGIVTSGIMTRLVKALGRASVVGLGGQGVQQSMDRYTGIDTTSENGSLGLRIGGAFVGEGVATALAAAGKGILGVGAKLVNSGTKLTSDLGEVASAVDTNVITHAATDITPTINSAQRDALKVPEIPSVGEELGNVSNSGYTTVPYRDIASKLKDAMKADKIGSLGHIFDMTDSEINAAALSKTPTMKEQVLLHGVGNRLIGEKVAKQTEVDNVLQYYFNHGLKTVAIRPTNLTEDVSHYGAKSWVFDPREYVGNIADNQFDSIVSKEARQTAMLKAQKVAFQGLDSKVTNHIMDIREKHANLAQQDPNFTVTQATLDSEGLTPTQQDSYWAAGKLLDFSALLEEQSAMKNITEKGIKQLHGNRQVQVLKELKGQDAGSVMVRDIKGGEPFAVHQSELQDVTQVMGYRKYATPRRTDSNYLAGTFDSTTGKLQIHTASPYKGEMQDFVNKLDGEYKDTSKSAFYFNTHTGDSSMNFGIGSNSAAALDVMDDKGINALRQALKSSSHPDLTEDQLKSIRLGFDNVTFGSITSQKVAGKRSLEGLKTVTGDALEYKPHNEALTQHLMEVAALDYKDFRLSAISKFKEDFASVLKDPLGDWDQPITNVLGQGKLVSQAKTVQNYLRRSVFGETSYGKSVRQGIGRWAETKRAEGGLSKTMIDGIETTPIIKNIFDSTRGGTAFLRKADSFMVFAGNFGSFLTQVAAPIGIIGGAKGFTRPDQLIKGIITLTEIMAIKAGAKNIVSKDANAALRALRQSGFVNDAQLDDMAYRAMGQTSSLYNLGMKFVSSGENVNGTMAWIITREEMKDLARKGQLRGITKTLTKEDMDSPEFIQMVSQKAKVLRLDMTPAGRIGLTQGIGKDIFQWCSPVIKTWTLFFSKELSGAEKFGAGLGLFSLYGLSAVPFFGTAAYLYDKTKEWSASDNIDSKQFSNDITDNVAHMFADKVSDLAGFTPQQKQFFKTTVDKGGISALTGSDIALYQRMSMTLFNSQVTKHGTQDILDSIPMVSIFRHAAETSSNIAEMLGNLHSAYNLTPEQAAMTGQTLPSDQQKIIDLRKTIDDVMNQVGNVVPGIGRIADVLNNHPDTRRYLNPQLEGQPDTGFVTRSGKRIETGEVVTTPQRMLMLFGIVPAPVQANREVLTNQYDRVRILTNLKDEWVQKYKNSNTAVSRTKTMQDAFRTAAEAERVLMATYQGALSIATGSSDNKPYKTGTLRKQWFNAFRAVDEEAISGNRTTSRGEQ